MFFLSPKKIIVSVFIYLTKTKIIDTQKAHTHIHRAGARRKKKQDACFTFFLFSGLHGDVSRFQKKETPQWPPFRLRPLFLSIIFYRLSTTTTRNRTKKGRQMRIWIDNRNKQKAIYSKDHWIGWPCTTDRLDQDLGTPLYFLFITNTATFPSSAPPAVIINLHPGVSIQFSTIFT